MPVQGFAGLLLTCPFDLKCFCPIAILGRRTRDPSAAAVLLACTALETWLSSSSYGVLLLLAVTSILQVVTSDVSYDS